MSYAFVRKNDVELRLESENDSKLNLILTNMKDSNKLSIILDQADCLVICEKICSKYPDLIDNMDLEEIDEDGISL
jgi:hypothetical protein